MMRNYIQTLLVLFMSVLVTHVQADEVASTPDKPKVLMYIQPVEYTNPIKLWHYYKDYWFYQGPVVEAEARQKISQQYGDVEFCDGNASGRVLLWLQPKMFYNPQLEVFYGEVMVNVYKGQGEFVTSYRGKSNVRGMLGAYADIWIQKAYALAVDHALAKMQRDVTLQNFMQDINGEAISCSMISLLPTAKIRAMSF